MHDCNDMIMTMSCMHAYPHRQHLGSLLAIRLARFSIIHFISFLFSTMPKFPVTTCPTGSYLKSVTWQSQLRFVVAISLNDIL